MEQRWGFLRPWTSVLRGKIKYKALNRDWDVWGDTHRLEVRLSMRCHFSEDSDGEEFELDWEWSAEEYFQTNFQQAREALALYYSKFVSAYEAEDISIWAMTTQNEPTEQFAFRYWQTLRFNVTTERDFVKRDLGPTMKKNHPDMKIIMMDDQKDLLLDWDATLLDADSAQYVSGVGVHWYKDLAFLLDTAGNFDHLETFHTSYPDVFILATEACEGYLLDGIITGAGPKLQNPTYAWQRAQIYARDIIGDLSDYASAGRTGTSSSTALVAPRGSTANRSTRQFSSTKRGARSSISSRCSTRWTTSPSSCRPTRCAWP
jgi:hypothetical protein